MGILALLTPAFVDKLEGVVGDVVRFFWPTKADSILQVVGSVLTVLTTVIAVLAAKAS